MNCFKNSKQGLTPQIPPQIPHPDGRDLAAYLANRRTTATLRELATAFGLSHPDSVSNLIRRAQNAISGSKAKKEDLVRIDELLQKQ